MKAEHDQNGLLYGGTSPFTLRWAALPSPCVAARPARHSRPGGRNVAVLDHYGSRSCCLSATGQELLLMDTLLPCWLQKLTSTGASAFLDSVSPSLGLHGRGGIAPNGTRAAAAAGLVSLITAAPWDWSGTQRCPGSSPCHRLLEV